MTAKMFLKSTCLAAAALTFGVLPALAQDTATDQPAPPSQIADVDGVTFLGNVSGLPAWSTPDADFIWLQTPENGLAAAFVYDGDSTDIGSPMIDQDPLPLASLLAPPAQQLAVSPDDLGIALPVPKPIASMTENADGTIDFELPETAIETAKATLEELPEEVRTQLLIDLVNRLQPVETEADYKAAIAGWQEAALAVAANAAQAPAPTGEASAPAEEAAPPTAATPTDEPASDTALDEADPVYTGPEIALMPPMEDGPTVADMLGDPAGAVDAPGVDQGVAPADVDAVAPAEDQGAAVTPAPELLDFTRTSTFWFSVGAREAPVVYAYIDPMCPFCARTVAALKPAIDAGELQLRVILTPLVSKESPNVIAGILSTENAMETFLAHETAMASGTTSPVKPVEFATLPTDIADGLRANYKTVIDARLPEVPFFAFATTDGPQYLSGEQTENVFTDALPEPSAN